MRFFNHHNSINLSTSSKSSGLDKKKSNPFKKHCSFSVSSSFPVNAIKYGGFYNFFINLAEVYPFITGIFKSINTNLYFFLIHIS